MPELPPAVRGFGVTFATMFKKVVTEEYPEQADRYPPKPRFHGRHQLNRWADGLEKCIGCELCAWACPADAILVETAQDLLQAKAAVVGASVLILAANYILTELFFSA